MYLEIDFNSDEAFYVQLCNQIIIGIATSRLQEGDPLPSVRQLADQIGINMHTVNKPIPFCGRRGIFAWTGEPELSLLWMRIRSRRWKI